MKQNRSLQRWIWLLFPKWIARKEIFASVAQSYGVDARWWWTEGRIFRAIAMGEIVRRIERR